MAGRRAATQVMRSLRQPIGSSVEFRPVLDSHLPAVVIPRLSSLFQPQLIAGHKHVEQTAYGGGRAFSSRQLHSEAQSAKDDEETNKYEHSKMNDEGGGSVVDFHEKAAEIREAASEKVKGVNADNLIDEAGKEVDKAKDVTKETKEGVAGTASELKDVAVEAVKAVGRDVGKVAEKVGLTSQNLSDVKEVGVEARKAAGRDAAKVAEKMGVNTGSVSETATEVKEVGVEAGKAVGRDAGKVAEKVGLKSDKK